MDNIREQIKKKVLANANMATRKADLILNDPTPSLHTVQENIRDYVYIKFLLDPADRSKHTLNELAQMSIDRTILLGLPIAKEFEVATTCGSAGSAPMKVALLLNNLCKDLKIKIDPRKLGMVRDTDELGVLVYDSLISERSS